MNGIRVGWMVWVLWAGVWFSTAGAMEAEEILAKVDGNMLSGSLEMFMRVTNQRPGGQSATVVLYGVRQAPDRAGVLVVSPDSQKGISVLRVGNEVWMHVPGELQPRSVSLVHSVVGGVFTNNDLLPVALSGLFTPSVISEDKGAYTLQLEPKKEKAFFTRVWMRVNRALMVPEQVRYYAANNQMFGSIEWSEPRQFGLLPPRPTVGVSQSKSNPGYTSTLSIGQIRAREFPPEALTLESLPRLGMLLKDVSAGQSIIP